MEYEFCVWNYLKKTIMHNQINTQTLYFVTQYGPIGMSSPVSTGILKFRGRGAPSAQSRLSALGAPPAWSRSGRAAPRFPTLCKRCASFRTTNQQPLGLIRVHKGHREVKAPNDKRGYSQVKGERSNMNRKESIQIIQLTGKSHIRGVFQVGKSEGRRGTQEQGFYDSWVS